MSRITGYGNSVQQTNSPEEVSQPTGELDSGVPPSAPTDPAVDVPANQTDFANEAKRMLDLGAGLMKKSLQDAVDTVEHGKTVAETVVDGATEAVQDKIREGVVDTVQTAQQAKQFVEETGTLVETVVDRTTDKIKETVVEGVVDAVQIRRQVIETVAEGVVDAVKIRREVIQTVETVVDGATEQVKETIRKGANDAVEFARGDE